MSGPVRFIRACLSRSVDLPGDALGKYPRKDDIIETFPKMGRQGYLLTLTELAPGIPILRIEHPRTKLREDVPWHLVLSVVQATDEVVLAAMDDTARNFQCLGAFGKEIPKKAAGAK